MEPRPGPSVRLAAAGIRGIDAAPQFEAAVDAVHVGEALLDEVGGRANPLAAILSAAMLLRFHWHDETGATRIERAVESFLREEGHLDHGLETTRVVGEGVLQRL